MIEKQICTRLAEIANIPTAIGEACSGVGSVIIGVAACILSVPTLGYSDRINKEVYRVNDARFIIPNIFRRTLLILNPSAPFEEANKQGMLPLFTIINQVVLKIFGVIPSFEDKDYDPVKFSRPVMLVHLPLLMVTKIMDFALGVVIAAVAMATFGYFEALNDIAYIELGGLGMAAVIPAVLLCGLVNPSHRVRYRY